MIKYKSKEEIEIMREGGRKLQAVVAQLLKRIQPGITTEQIDNLASDLILKTGGEPSFKKVKGYKWSTCLPVNEQIVHTPPSKRGLKQGDLLTIDIGLFFCGFHTDYATTLVVAGTKDKRLNKFLDAGREALDKAISFARAGNYLGQISQAIQEKVQNSGYHIVKELTGHGIGRDLHEDPLVLGFVKNDIKKTIKIKQGLVLAIEVIYSMGSPAIVTDSNDQWSISTVDKSYSACFEETVAILVDQSLILTRASF